MSLSALRRITCTMMPSACGCKPGSEAVYCSPVLRNFTKRGVNQPNALRMFSTVPTPDQNKEPEKELTFKEKAKNMWKNYGKLAIVTYIGVYGSTLGMMYFALDSGVFNAATFGFDHAAAITKFCDIVETVTGTTTLPAYIKEHPFEWLLMEPFLHSLVGTFAVGWFMTKFTEPLRLATTIVIVPPIARYWNKLTAFKVAEAAKKSHKEF